MIINSPVNGTSFPFDTFTTSGLDITRAIKNPAAFAGATWDLGASYPANTIIAAKATIAVSSGTSPQLRFANNNNGSGASGSALRSAASGYALFPFTGAGQWLQVGGANTLYDFSATSPSAKLIRGNHGRQATAAAQPKWQTGGLARFDGMDDNLLTTLTPGATAMTLMAKVSTSTANAYLMGSRTNNFDRCGMYIDVSGKLNSAFGSALIVGGNSILSATHVLACVLSGSTIETYVDGALVASGSLANSVNTTVPLGLGGLNSSGTAAGFSSADMYRAIAIKKALTAAQIAAITTLWGTS